MILLGPQTPRQSSCFFCRRHPASPGREELLAPGHRTLHAASIFTLGCFKAISHPESPQSPPDPAVSSPTLFYTTPLPAPSIAPNLSLPRRLLTLPPDSLQLTQMMITPRHPPASFSTPGGPQGKSLPLPVLPTISGCSSAQSSEPASS